MAHVTRAEPDEIEVTTCDTWDDFIAAVRVQQGFRGERVYRGHGDPNWRLESKLDRWARAWTGFEPKPELEGHFKSTFELADVGFRKHFKELAAGIAGVRTDSMPSDDVDRLARHHGLVTRLLDWTRSPFIAAFFACTDCIARYEAAFLSGAPVATIDFREDDVFDVWELTLDEDLRRFSTEFKWIDDLSDVAYRQKAQRGVFTKLKTPMFLDLRKFLVSKGCAHFLHRFVVPAVQSVRAYLDLELMNITFATVFPDLDGAAKQANIYFTRRGFLDSLGR